MRVHSLWLENFKNLQDFAVEFDRDHEVSVIVGRNGVGKSNLVEALTIIYRDLDLGLSPSFAYKLTYECRGHEVQITAHPNGKPRLLITVDGKRHSQAKLRGEDGLRLLPDFVFGYYSGPSNRLQSHFARHQENFSRALRDGQERPLRRLFYAQPMHSQFVLLAFFLAGDQERFLQEYLGIERLESILFVLRRPYWAGSGRGGGRAGGDARFWRARGTVAHLLGQLYEGALAPMRRQTEAEAEPGRRDSREHLYLYFPDMSAVRQIAEQQYGSAPQELFKAFESILAADLLDEVRIRVQTSGASDSLVFRELSEGEQQLLMVLGLLKFTREDESLFLLDEPDTHLNPAWSLNYVHMLEDVAGDAGSSSQLLMATHDPLVIAGLLKEQVVILERDHARSKVQAVRPEHDPRGMGVSGLLTSDVYDLPSELDPATYQKVERRRWLASAEWEELSAEDREELHSLTAELEDLDFTFTTRDPLYTEFERAMAALPSTGRQVLNPGDAKQQRMIAMEVLQDVLNKSQPGE